jgi:2-polyprenyl-3-methyl-5-hydroxy-6-metoxy-1,4-benzoquinol methylase
VASEYVSYFKHRRVSADSYAQYTLPAYVERRLPKDKGSRILDFGCGFGQFVSALTSRGYREVVGYDIEPTAIDHCTSRGVPVIDGNKTELASLASYDFIFSSHVIEHIPKTDVIAALCTLRALLSSDGTMLICVPNAQANTGCYWAYEDFTHHTAYTSGSLYYVLSKAGFSHIEFFDIDCTEGMRPGRRWLKRRLLSVYKANYRFWNRVTSSATHPPSPDIFSYEIKALARR